VALHVNDESEKYLSTVSVPVFDAACACDCLTIAPLGMEISGDSVPV